MCKIPIDRTTGQSERFGMTMRRMAASNAKLLRTAINVRIAEAQSGETSSTIAFVTVQVSPQMMITAKNSAIALRFDKRSIIHALCTNNPI
jgi:hypothetical protein